MFALGLILALGAASLTIDVRPHWLAWLAVIVVGAGFDSAVGSLRRIADALEDGGRRTRDLIETKEHA